MPNADLEFSNAIDYARVQPPINLIKNVLDPIQREEIARLLSPALVSYYCVAIIIMIAEHMWLNIKLISMRASYNTHIIQLSVCKFECTTINC